VTPAEYGRMVHSMLLREWRELAAYDYLTREGLLAIRGRVDATNNEFPNDPETELTRLIISDAIAHIRGISPEDMPAAIVVPDDLRELS